MSGPHTDAADPRCTHSTADGRRCKGRVWAEHMEDSLCWPHHPSSAGLRAQGGRRSRDNDRALDSEAPDPSDIEAVLEYTVAQTLKGSQTEGTLRTRAIVVKALESHRARVGDREGAPIPAMRELTATEQQIIAERAAQIILDEAAVEFTSKDLDMLKKRLETAIAGKGILPIEVVLEWPADALSAHPPSAVQREVSDLAPPAQEDPTRPGSNGNPPIEPEQGEAEPEPVELPSWVEEAENDQLEV